MVSEDGSDIVSELWETPYRSASSILCGPEGFAALAAARRGGRLTAAGHTRARAELELVRSELTLIGVDAALADQAGRLAERFALRGYDAVHLATASALAHPVTFVTWDRELRSAAAQSGCATAPAD